MSSSTLLAAANSVTVSRNAVLGRLEILGAVNDRELAGLANRKRGVGLRRVLAEGRKTVAGGEEASAGGRASAQQVTSSEFLVH